MSKKRREVKKITIVIEGGKNVIIDVDNGDEMPEAIFFGNKGVYLMLTPFYDGKDIKLKRADVEPDWGKKICDVVFETETEKTIDAEVINKAWNTPDEQDMTLAMLRKTTGCPFG